MIGVAVELTRLSVNAACNARALADTSLDSFASQRYCTKVPLTSGAYGFFPPAASDSASSLDSMRVEADVATCGTDSLG